MRRSLGLRVVALGTLLCVLGLAAAGCTWSISIIIGLDDFFDEFAYDIYRENADALGNYYASYVFVTPAVGPGTELSRAQIINRWREYFAEYSILRSGIISRTRVAEHGDVTIVDVHRFEERRLRGTYSGGSRVDVFEQYTLYKVGGSWRIGSVWVRDEFVISM